MAKKKGGKRGKGGGGGDRIPLESAVDSDEGHGAMADGDWMDPADVDDARETGELRAAMDAGRAAHAARSKAWKNRKKGKEEGVVFGISDSEEEMADSDLDDGGPVAPYEDEMVGGEGWGGKKKHFYGGNPNERRGRPDEDLADSEEDEAELEAKESKKLQVKQLEAMDEEDFFDAFADPSDKDPEKKKGKKAPVADSDASSSVKVDVSKMSKKERARLFAKEAPEFPGVVAEFDARMREAHSRLAPVVALMDSGAIPPDGPAADYVRTKYQIVLNYCANLSCYVMFKARRADLRLHPLTGRLVQYRQLLDQMEAAPLDAEVMAQADQLVAAREEGGQEAVEAAVRKAKKMALRELAREKTKSKKLRILEDAKASTSKSKKADERDEANPNTNDLTLDELRALEMYRASRKRNDEEEEEDDDEDAGGEGAEGAGEEEAGEEEEGDGRRHITRQIEKNKGLTPKRSKLQRNPRVKHRVKFQKAKVRRKGQVREVRTEVTKYAGELSGINARVKKGVKLS